MSWVQRHLIPPQAISPPTPRFIVAVADCTFFTRGYGVLVVKDIRTKQCLYFKEVTSESPRHYAEARASLLKQGIHIVAIVLDGRKGVREVFSDIPVQMCHFHQMQIVRRYLTIRPKMQAAQELKLIAHTLTKTDETTFRIMLEKWHGQWKEFMAERTYQDNGKHWTYTHRKLRSTYRSLMTNLPFLFNHKAHPELSLPSTTNALDGLFSHMKQLLLVHRGMTKEKRWKLIQTILKKR